MVKKLENNEIIRECESYHYLRIHFKGKTDVTDIDYRINKTRRIIKSLTGLLWSKEIRKQRKATIYYTLIKARRCTDQKLKENLFEATEMDSKLEKNYRRNNHRKNWFCEERLPEKVIR